MSKEKRKYVWPLVAAPWTEAELHAAIDPVLASGNLTMGERVAEFEEKFARMVGSRYAVMVNSGSSANLLAVAASESSSNRFRLDHGREAIVPAVAWATTYAPLAQHGFKLRIVDIDPLTLSADIGQVRSAINDKTRILVGVSILGIPANLNAMRDLAAVSGLYFIEDNCESLGAKVAGRQAGTFGDIGTFSMFYSHHISSIEGGLLVTDDDVVADYARCIRAHGWTRDISPASWMHQIGAKINFEGEYEFVLPGYNLRPTEIQAAIGLSQLPGLDLAQLYRKANWATFKDAFCNHPHFSTQQSPHGQAVPFGFVLVADSAERRAAALLAMNTAGIECRMVTGGCITRHPVIEQYDHEAVNGLPVANHVHDCGFFVGNQPRDLSAEIELLYSTLKEI